MSRDEGLDEVVTEFLVESHENLDTLDRDLVTLEKDPRSVETLSSVFRTIHTIKGTCGFLGFERLEGVTHSGENLLSKLRDGQLTLNPEMTSALLAMVDAVRQMLAKIETVGSDGDDDYRDLVARLDALQAATATTAPASETDAAAPAIPEDTSESAERPSAEATGSASGIPTETAGEASVAEGSAAGAPATAGPASPTDEPATETSRPAPANDAAETAPATGARAEGGGHAAESSIRVDVNLLDKLMNLVGELVLARNQILQFNTVGSGDSAFTATTQRLNLITTELQEGVMKTRMQTIGNIWMKFPRVVRDLALACNKQVRVEMEGRDTELDKTIIEAIKDPLTHLVRNAVDHGIEPPDVRRAAGKPAEGRLFMRAFHEGGQVNIEMTDDGGGIDPARLKAKAVEKGLLSSEQVSRLSDREALNLIFLPGFSTAKSVSNVSGRGVGMDVVKTNIEKIGGTVDIQSQLGSGTTLRMKIPLTLAIIPALTVTSRGDRYAIPQVSLVELVRLEGDQARCRIEQIHGAPVYRLRGRLLPLVYLDRILAGNADSEPPAADEINIVVLQADDRQFGVVVESIMDTEEIVVKPLGKQLKSITVFAGATIMGDGKVALILDVLGLAQHSRVVSEVRDRGIVDQHQIDAAGGDERQSILLLRVGPSGRIAIPLSLVDRLEEFPASAIERSAGQEVVQYRGRILPLIRLASALGYGRDEAADSGVLQVVVYTDEGRSLGLVVDQVLDIVQDVVKLEHRVERDGILGSAVIQDRVTDLLDLRQIIGSVVPCAPERAEAA